MTLPRISLYKIGLLVALVAWYLERVGILPGLLPPLTFLGIAWGFWLFMLLLIGAIYFLIWFGEKMLWPFTGVPEWVERLRGNEGSTRYADYLLLIIVVLFGLYSIGSQTLSPYGVLAFAMAIAGASQSLRGYQETKSTPTPGIVERTSNADAVHAFSRWESVIGQMEFQPHEPLHPRSDTAGPESSPFATATEVSTPEMDENDVEASSNSEPEPAPPDHIDETSDSGDGFEAEPFTANQDEDEPRQV